MARRFADRHIQSGRFAQAQAQLDEAQALIDADAGHGTRTMVVGKRAWLALELGDLAGACALLRGRKPDDRAEGKHLCAWVGAALSLAEDDIAAAQRALQDSPPAADAPTDILAMLLVQHLAVAHRAGMDDTAARARAQGLVTAGAVPSVEAQRLRAALAEAPIDGGSTPGA